MPKNSSVFDDAQHWKAQFRKGQLIYEEGEPSRSIYRVESGCVRLQVHGPDGERQILAFLFPGEMFGLCVDTRTSSAEAVTDVELTRYSLQSVVELSSRSTEVTLALLKTADARYADLARHLEQIAHLPATERVLWFLSWLAAHGGGPQDDTVRLPMSRRDVGDYLSLTPETLSRVIRQLEINGVLVAKGPRTFALKRPAFASRSEMISPAA